MIFWKKGEKKTTPTKLAFQLAPKEKFFPKGSRRPARVVSNTARYVITTKGEKCFAEIVYNDEFHKGVCVLYSWNEELKLPLKPDPKYKNAWLTERLERWLKKQEIKQPW